MNCSIVDYHMSNLKSVKAACDYVNLEAEITSDIRKIADSKCLILPGVGSFGKAMSVIKNLKIDQCIHDFYESGKLIVGICLGMQLFFTSSEEFGENSGLNIIKGKVKKFSSNDYKIKVPQISWNKIQKKTTDWSQTLLNYNKDREFMYFVHSYYVDPDNKDIILSETEYEKIVYPSSIVYKNIFATQFHPEKSGEAGLNIYRAIKERLEITNN